MFIKFGTYLFQKNLFTEVLTTLTGLEFGRVIDGTVSSDQMDLKRNGLHIKMLEKPETRKRTSGVHQTCKMTVCLLYFSTRTTSYMLDTKVTTFKSTPFISHYGFLI